MEITTTTENKYPAILDSFVQQGRACLMSAAQNLLMFGRVIAEAKPHIPHGQFENWVRDSFGISVRTAQKYMSVYKRFGDREAFSGIRYTTLREMLALPDGEEETFIEEHAVGDMSTREVREAVDQAVKKAHDENAKLQEMLESERAARYDAMHQLQNLRDNPVVPDSVMQSIREKDEKIALYAEQMIVAKNAADSALAEQKRASAELAEVNEMLEAQQADYNRMQQELLNARSAMAKGDAERKVTEQLTADQFSAAVRSFMGAVAQIPYMSATFADMEITEFRGFDELLQTVEGWCESARRAINTVKAGDSYVR